MSEALEWRPLGDLAAHMFLGLALNRVEPAGASNAQVFQVVNVRDIEHGTAASRDRLATATLPAARAERYRLQEGDVLVTCRGSQLKAAVVEAELKGAIPSSNLIAVRPKPEILGSVLVAALNHPVVRQSIESRFRSAALTVALNVRELAAVLVPVPPIDVQHRIRELLSAANRTYEYEVRAAEGRRAIAHAVVERLLSDVATSASQI